MLAEGRGVAKDPAIAAALYAKACDADVVDACTNLGVMYLGQSGLVADKSKARAYLQKACDRGDKKACGYLFY